MFKSLTLLAPLAVAFAAALPTSISKQQLGKRSFDSITTVTNTAALAWYSEYAADSGAQAISQSSLSYQCYNGVVSSYPAFSEWPSFDSLWLTFEPQMQSYEINGVSTSDVLRTKILKVSKEDKVDARFILAIVMQESTGNVKVSCTAGSYPDGNCGVMQGPHGSVQFDSSTPAASIEQMIRDGVEGTPGSWPTGGPGLAWWLDDAASQSSWTGMTISGNPYEAARGYNTGKVDASDLDNAAYGSTVSYANDVANRLLGWSGDAAAGCGYSS